jgi:hypothetical protein
MLVVASLGRLAACTLARREMGACGIARPASQHVSHRPYVDTRLDGTKELLDGVLVLPQPTIAFS